jgi:GNAT superfamily N-acetyltransferase
MQVERARPEHLDGVRAIAAAYGNLDDWPGRPDPLDFELRAGTLWVARDGDAVVGYAGLVRHGEISHLADLFVARDRLGAGIGRRLLQAALARDGVRITFASGDPRALPLYVRAGLRPLAPLLYLEGALRAEAAGPRRVAVDAVAGRDAVASGRERPDVLAFLAETGAYALAGARPGAYAVVRPAPGGAWLGPAAADADELLAFVGAATAEHARARLAVCGPHPALAPLIGAGFRVLAADTYMASRPGVLDMERYLPHVDLG